MRLLFLVHADGIHIIERTHCAVYAYLVKEIPKQHVIDYLCTSRVWPPKNFFLFFFVRKKQEELVLYCVQRSLGHYILTLLHTIAHDLRLTRSADFKIELLETDALLDEGQWLNVFVCRI